MARQGMMFAARLFTIMICTLLTICTLLHCSAAQQPIVRVSINGERISSLYKVRQTEVLIMTCVVDDLPVGVHVTSYQWFFQRTMLSAAAPEGMFNVHEFRNASLTIQSVSYLDHLGDYSCRVNMQLTSNVISLIAKFAAIFPANRTHTVYVVQNESAVLECVVVVPPDDNSATVGWLKVTDGSVLSTPSAGNNVFHIQHARREDSGEYRCGVSTENSGSEDADIRLVVITKPEFSTPPTDSTLFVAMSHRIFCPVRSESAINFTWYLNGNPLQSNDKLSIIHETTISTVRLINVTYSEAGSYKCVVSNSAGSSHQVYVITVLGPPEITLPSDYTFLNIPLNKSAEMLDCPHVSNPPTSSVQWLKGNQDLLLEEDKYTTFENGSLLILNLMNDDNGNYTCRVQNIRGMDQATYRVQVINIPACPKDLLARIMNDSTYSVYVSWSALLVDVSQPLNYYIIMVFSIEEEYLMQFEVNASVTEVLLTELRPGESYQVSLQAINIAGSSPPVTTTITLPVSTPSLSFDVSPLPDGHSLLTQWQLIYDGGPSINKFNIAIYAVNGGVQLLSYSVDADVNAKRQLITGLEAATNYSVQVNVSNGYRHNYMEFTVTTNNAPPSQPSTPRITLTTTHVFKMTFTVQEGSRPITGFLLNTTKLDGGGRDSTTQMLIDVDDVDSLVELIGGEKEVLLVIGGLEQYRYFTFQVAAISIVGKGEFSEPSSPTALDDNRVLYYIISSVVGGAAIVFIIIIVVAMVMLCTTRRIQRTKRTLSINSSASQKRMPQSFIPPPVERGSRRPSLQLTSLNDCCSSHCATPLSSVSDYRHHMLSSTTGEAPPIYDKLSDYQKGSTSVSSEDEKRAGSFSSDIQSEDNIRKDSVFSHGQPEVGRVVVDMYSSEGRIDSVVHELSGNHGASIQTDHLHSSVGKIQAKSAYSLFPQQQQQCSPLGRQLLPTSLHQLPMFSQNSAKQYLLCPPKNMAGSSPAINCRYSCDSMLDNSKPTSYMTDV